MSPGTTDAPLVAFRMEARADDEDALVTALWEQGTTGVEVQPGAPGATGTHCAHCASLERSAS